jgi:nucleotide-binding universal stress UspA family protein
MTIARIAVATDFSPCARSALDYALPLAAKEEARITLIHAWSAPVIATAVDMPPMLQLPGAPGITVTEYAHKLARNELHGLLETVRASGATDANSRLLFGDARVVVVDASTEFDLVVLGTHGLGGLARMVLGSVADYVVRHAHCPVLTVRRTAD